MTDQQAVLIPVTQTAIDGALTQTVNARDLHAFLGVGKIFAAWIQDRIKYFDFIENQDFRILSEIGKNSNGRGRPSKEYALTLDMAKELSMVERTAKGKEARLYFIACERRAKAASQASQKSLEAADLEQTAILYSSITRLYCDTVESAKMSGLDVIQAISFAEEQLALQGIDIREFMDVDRYKQLASTNMRAQQFEQEKRERAASPRKTARTSTVPESSVNLYNYQDQEYLTIDDIARVLTQKTGCQHKASDLQFALVNLGFLVLDPKLPPYLTREGRDYAVFLEFHRWGTTGAMAKFAWTPQVMPILEDHLSQFADPYQPAPIYSNHR